MTDRRFIRVDLLRALLAALVDEWGYEVVSRRLDEFRAAGEVQPEGTLARQPRGGKAEVGERVLEKPTACALAAKVSLPPGQKQLIRQLAMQYDGKQFLPTSGDIRYFFEVHGEVPPTAKQRSEAFRKVLRLLSTMSESALQKMIDADAHSGPSRLAPISEAMRGVGEQRSVNRNVAVDSSAVASEEVASKRGEKTDRPSNT